MSEPKLTLIIGAAGAIGKKLVAAILEKKGRYSVLAALHRTPLPKGLADNVISEFGIDVRDKKLLTRVLKKYAERIDTVWNLAAPLSIETAKDPTLAYDITVNGMRHLLQAMKDVGLGKICFTDSIGSYGATAPRQNVPANWLVDHPKQDPGSDYGLQKRECREVMRHFANQHGFDTRWCVVPGVLHDSATWGKGTTEYALDALLHSVEGRVFHCPVPLDVRLPMIMVSDLVAGMIALMDANPITLQESEQGYAIAGFSFTPKELFDEIRTIYPSFEWIIRLDENMTKFTTMWPDSISGAAARRDLGWTSRVGLQQAVQDILLAHKNRMGLNSSCL